MPSLRYSILLLRRITIMELKIKLGAKNIHKHESTFLHIGTLKLKRVISAFTNVLVTEKT